jgi:hypothetical protein
MSGALAAIIPHSTQTYAMTVGTGGAGVFGFAQAVYGALNGLSSNTLKGVNIAGIFSSNVATDFTLQLSGAGALPQTFVQRFVIVDTAGTVRTYLASAASFISGATNEWKFGTGSSPAWTSTASPRQIQIFF